jgi:hypothetical protein
MNSSTRELDFLQDLTASKRSNAWIIQNYGIGFAYNALRRGLAINPLGEDGITHTNLWQPSEQGKIALTNHKETTKSPDDPTTKNVAIGRHPIAKSNIITTRPPSDNKRSRTQKNNHISSCPAQQKRRGRPELDGHRASAKHGESR